MTKLKKDIKEGSKEFYLNEIFEKNRVEVVKESKLIKILIVTIIIFTSFVLYLFFNANSDFVKLTISSNKIVVYILAIIIAYIEIIVCSILTFTLMTKSYRQHFKHELTTQKLTGKYKILYSIITFVNLIWIIPVVILRVLLTKLKQDKIVKFVPELLVGVVIALVIILKLLNIFVFNYDIIFKDQPIFERFEQPFIYCLVFILIVVFKKIPLGIIKMSLIYICHKNKGTLEYKNVCYQYKILCQYILLLLSIILLALGFNEYEQMYVDALFYTTTISSLWQGIQKEIN